MTIAHNALLCSLSIRQWSARKLDKKESAQIQLKHGVDAKVARVNKSILQSFELETVAEHASAIRKFFYANTLPWGMDGVGILRAASYLSFQTELGELKREWDRRVDRFINAYPQQVAEAQNYLNGLYDPDDYPPAYEMAERFSMDVNFMPLPDHGDWRLDVEQEHMEKLRAELEASVQAQVADSMAAAWRRLYEVVKHAEERLAQPDAIFRDSLVENARRICETLPSLNITGDPALEQLTREVASKLGQREPDMLRSNPALRQETAEDMRDVMHRMSAFFAA